MKLTFIKIKGKQQNKRKKTEQIKRGKKPQDDPPPAAPFYPFVCSASVSPSETVQGPKDENVVTQTVQRVPLVKKNRC